MRRKVVTAAFGAVALIAACVYGLNGLVVLPAALAVALNTAGIIKENSKESPLNSRRNEKDNTTISRNYNI